MIPELTNRNVNLLATMFLDVNSLIPRPVTLTTFVGYAFPTDEDHPEPWGKRAGQLRRAIKRWIGEHDHLVGEIESKRGKVTFAWKDPLKIAALRAQTPRFVDDPNDLKSTKRFVLAYVYRKI